MDTNALDKPVATFTDVFQPIFTPAQLVGAQVVDFEYAETLHMAPLDGYPNGMIGLCSLLPKDIRLVSAKIILLATPTMKDRSIAISLLLLVQQWRLTRSLWRKKSTLQGAQNMSPNP